LAGRDRHHYASVFNSRCGVLDPVREVRPDHAGGARVSDLDDCQPIYHDLSLAELSADQEVRPRVHRSTRGQDSWHYLLGADNLRGRILEYRRRQPDRGNLLDCNDQSLGFELFRTQSYCAELHGLLQLLHGGIQLYFVHRLLHCVLL
jgi:hypothetical protein